MTSVMATRIAAAMGFLAVALGAFGAHALKKILEQHEAVATWQTAVFYHFIHAVMLYLLTSHQPLRRLPWWSFLVGIVIFSGSLYVLAVTNLKWLGAITPIGGVSFLVGWGCLLICAGREKQN